MKLEDTYIKFINKEIKNKEIHEIPPEFLKEYEITKLVLDNFGINCLSENQQKSLNLEAVSNWLRVSKYIHLQYDIPEILELLPERLREDLNLSHSKIESLPELEYVGG